MRQQYWNIIVTQSAVLQIQYNTNRVMATSKGGRPGDPIRQFFNRLDESKSKCIDCAERVSNKIERLRAHSVHTACTQEAVPEISTR